MHRYPVQCLSILNVCLHTHYSSITLFFASRSFFICFNLAAIVAKGFYKLPNLKCFYNYYYDHCCGSGDPDSGIRICILKDDSDPYGEVRIRIREIYGKGAETCHGKK